MKPAAAALPIAVLPIAALLIASDVLFVATPLTEPQSFTAEAEGPACDRAGNIYAVSFARKPTIGRISPDGKGDVFLEMPSNSLANGIRFDRKGLMYVPTTPVITFCASIRRRASSKYSQ